MRREITSAQQRELADLNVTIEEGLSVNGAQLSRTLGTGPALVARFTGSSERLIDLELRSQLAGRWRMASTGVIFAAIPAVIYLGAGLPGTTLTIGTLIAFTTLQGGLFRPLTALLGVGVSLVSSLALFARIFEYLDLPVDVDDPPHPVPVDPARVRGDVRFEDVTFAYPGSDRSRRDRRRPRRARGDHARARRRDRLGQEHARRARSPACYDPDAGRITIDGIDLRDLRLADLARIVGVVSQETYLLHTTVRENLRYAKPTPPTPRSRTPPAPRGSTTSSPTCPTATTRSSAPAATASPAARSSASRSPAHCCATRACSILDEATSALDTETERAVQRRVRRPRRGPHDDHHRPPPLDRARRRPDRRDRPRPRRRVRHARRACSPPTAATPRWRPDRCGTLDPGRVRPQGGT